MGRVEWSRLAPEEFEELVAIMLLRRHAGEGATRVRPGRGDGGVDVRLKLADGQLCVFQLKSFTGSLTSSHKRQIVGSWEQAKLTQAAAMGCWRLVVPMEPTPERLEWLGGVIDGAVEWSWDGVAFLDGLAAEFPDVVDYYLHGGRARILAQHQDLMGCVGLFASLSDGRPLTAGSITDGLMGLTRSLNSSDPHFRYEVRMAGQEPGRCTTPGHVLSVTHADADTGTFVTIDVVTRYRQAIEDRPIVANATVDVSSPEQREALRAFLDFGVPVAEVEADIVFHQPLPGGLPTPTGAMRLSAGGAGNAVVVEFDLEAADSHGDAIAVVPLTVGALTRGQLGTAFEAADATGAITIRARVLQDSDGPTNVNLGVSFAALNGKPVTACRTAIGFIAAMGSANSVSMRLHDGPRIGRLAIPAGAPPSLDAQDLLAILDDLVLIQRHCGDILRFHLDIDDADAADIASTAALLRGEPIAGTWEHLEVSVDTDMAEQIARDIETHPIVNSQGAGDRYVLGLPVPIGPTRVTIESAAIESMTPSIDVDTKTRIRLIPNRSNRVTIQLEGHATR